MPTKPITLTEYEHLETLRHALQAVWEDAMDARDKAAEAMKKIGGIRHQIQQRQMELQRAELDKHEV